MRNLLFVFFPLLLFLFVGCEKVPDQTSYRDIKMCIPYKVVVGSTDARIKEVIEQVFQEVDLIYNQWNPDSEISHINRLPAGAQATLSPQMAHFLPFVDKAVTLSEGRYDPTVAPLVTLWKNALEKQQLPTPDAIANAKNRVGWKSLFFEGQTIRKLSDSTCNFDGIAKGYCVDRLVEELQAIGITDIYVEWGGEIRVSGMHPEGRPWKVMVTGIGGSHTQGLETVELTNQAIASSGDYYQQWKVNGECYTHIVDTTTGEALRIHKGGVSSATVLAPTCTLADALATTCMLFPSAEEASAWATRVQRTPGLEEVRIWIVERP